MDQSRILGFHHNRFAQNKKCVNMLNGRRDDNVPDVSSYLYAQ